MDGAVGVRQGGRNENTFVIRHQLNIKNAKLTKKMDDRKDLGREGEQLAAEYLEAQGYMILERNWHFSHREIDIVARSGNEIVVVEVKTRTAPVRELPEQAVNRQKQRFLISAANAYVRCFHISMDVRFDMVIVVFYRGSPEISHIRNAFYPILC